jgi:cyclic 2,3-diphosphoglycerate synthetase
VKAIVLVDGEHHPDAVRAAIVQLRSAGDEIAGAVFCGGSEKVDPSRIGDAYGVPVVVGESTAEALTEALQRFGATSVIDLTDEPVLHPADRFRLASVALSQGAVYRGADFELRPPAFESVLTKPSISVYATGKRTGKTAVASAIARTAITGGFKPLIVAVGRGGPSEPRVIEAGTVFDARSLVEMADAGLHAASDYVEDAMTSGATTIGCRRVGGGLAGATVLSNAPSAARVAEERDEDLVILEGSGASIPDVAAAAGVICVRADESADLVGAYLNPYRLLLANLAVVTMAEQGSAAAEMEAAIRSIAPQIDVVPVTFRPRPLSPVTDKTVFFCCTASGTAVPRLTEHLERVHGCRVVGATHRLADGPGLVADLDAAPAYDVLLTEIKGPAIDVAARRALTEGREVVFVDNEVTGDGAEEAMVRVIERAARK